MKALEDKNAAEKDLKKSLESLWDGVKKKEDDAVIIAFLQEISRVARESAMGWIRVAPLSQSARNQSRRRLTNGIAIFSAEFIRDAINAKIDALDNGKGNTSE